MDDLDEQLALGVVALFARLEVEEPWRRDALCREHPEVNFFPARRESAEPARAICARCLVNRECDESLASLPRQESHYGVWAGTSGHERRRMQQPAVLRAERADVA